MDDPEQQAVNSLVRCGIADRTTSRRIVKKVITAYLSESPAEINVSDGDIQSLDDAAQEIDRLVWDIEEHPTSDHRRALISLISESQRLLRIARSYVVSDREGV